MQMAKFVLAIDQGTTGTTVLVVGQDGSVVSKGYKEFAQIFPQVGWVEHDPDAIWESTLSALRAALDHALVSPMDIAAIGITNQRETTVLWERSTMKPVHNAIVWQCRRTASYCEKLKSQGLEDLFRTRTGLVLDPYFSGTKLAWLLKEVPGVAALARQGKLAFGTVDSYLVARLTGGKVHVTDVSNASRTLLMNLESLNWDEELAQILDIPMTLLPRICGNAEVVGQTSGLDLLPDGIPIAGMAGDQQAALFGQVCFSPGEAKCTFGTGAFMLTNIGSRPLKSRHGLLTTVAWKLEQPTYAFEGSAFIAGAAVQWLRDGLQMINAAPEIEPLAALVPDSGGVVFVPALTGLGAPHWRPDARGAFLGMTRGTTRAHLARAVLEGIALQNHDIMRAMEEDLGERLSVVRVDGGAAANDLLMQLQADLLQTTIRRPKQLETTGLGAAFLAGLGTGFWADTTEVRKAWHLEREFECNPDNPQREILLTQWGDAVHKA
jgi:glycerol kinase